jgi:hypothetical protein
MLAGEPAERGKVTLQVLGEPRRILSPARGVADTGDALTMNGATD